MTIWAKGIDFKNNSNTVRIGGIGMFGTDTSVEKIYLGLGSEPWDNGLEITNDALTFYNNKIYHEGNKPTPSEISAAEVSHNHEWSSIISSKPIDKGTGLHSSVQGQFCEAPASYSHAEGYNTKAEGHGSHAEGYTVEIGRHVAYGMGSHVEGADCIAGTTTTLATEKFAAHAEGISTKASGKSSHAEGSGTEASGASSHAEGNNTKATEFYTHAEGNFTVASGRYSHAQNYYTTSSGLNSHAEGDNTIASGRTSHAEGYYTVALGNYSHAQGYRTQANAVYSHAEGCRTTASGSYSHAEGDNTIASGHYSHAQGCSTLASGNYSHASGNNAVSQGLHQTAIGFFNVINGSTNSKITSDAAFIIGNGEAPTRSNAFRVTWAGLVYSKGAYNTSGADYAEMFEWSDGNINNEERLGYFVTFDNSNGKIRIANDKDNYVLGVPSTNPAIIGDNYDEDWQYKYMTDKWGRILYKNKKAIDDGFIETPILNPEYKSTKEYISRKNRKEWIPVGLIGKLLVYSDGTCEVGDYCKPNKDGIATKSDNGYIVIEKHNDIIKILFK